ncbi:SMP-30/gluconolactonase/LRE family protein [Chitinophaga arvensicola]|uniref:Sugar lactone lactonase YvrE n=1 Tax=Chitinophaga arvensicola TaxID=29529 RepID=A0A1I0RSV2_9BACT|nr:SMP-30/gluconolactonase/LRE family protein [Chitinophaga arvensicola]SEW44447.1 Sugar lactone lactonase YvrE [Chitinophaga arvensicola]
MYKEWTASVVYPGKALLGEGPVWDARRRRLYFVDINGRRVNSFDPVNGNFQQWNTGKRTSLIIPASDGRFLLGTQGSLELSDLVNPASTLTLVEPALPQHRCNDGKCDAKGRLWFGTMHLNARPQEGALYCYDGSLRKVLDGISISNGICWSADNKTMYYIDTLERNIRAYDFDLAAGTLGKSRIVTTVADFPDGMCMDQEGMLWVAMWGGKSVHRYHPGSGELMGKIWVDAPHVSSCAFGGHDMNQLFITTAREGLTPAQLQDYPHSGDLFAVQLPFTGAPAHSFST